MAALSGASATALEMRGRVLDPEQKPVADAAVWLVQDRVVTTAKSATDGAFRFDDVAVGPVEVVARKEGLAFGGYTGFVVGDGDIIIQLARPAELPLRILGADYAPLAGARIRRMMINNAFHVAVEDLVDTGFPLLRSDDAGLLRITDLPEGAFLRFTVTHSDYADANVPYLPVLKTRQDIVMTPGIPVHGRITAEDKGVARARVAVFAQTDKGDVGITEVLTDPDGFFRVRVPEGEYRVAARHPDYATPPPLGLLLADPEKDYTADLTLLPPRIIAGRVVREEDAAMPGVRVAYRVDNIVYEETLTQPDGAFQLKVGTQKGVVQVLAPPGFMTEQLSTISFDLQDKKYVSISPIRLMQLPEVRGRVRDADGAPAARALLSSRNLVPPYWTIADDEGRFTIRLGAMPGEGDIAFSAEHRLRFQRALFTFDPRNKEELEVVLAPFDPDTAERPTEPPHNNLSYLAGKKAPELQCDAWFNSGPLCLADLADKVVVLTFWGSFDDSPLAMNRLTELCVLFDLLRDVDDVAFVAIHDASTEPNLVGQYVERLRLPFPVGCDADPFVSFVNYGVNFIPQTVLIDKEGILRYHQVEGRLLELIKDLRRRG